MADQKENLESVLKGVWDENCPRFLVVSYDEDEQQWFYDVVQAKDSDAAEELVCTIWPYVIAADASSLEQLKQMAQQTETTTPEQIAAQTAAIREESGVCEYCGQECDGDCDEAQADG